MDRRDQRERDVDRLRQLITAGLESGEARPLTDAVRGELRAAALSQEK